MNAPKATKDLLRNEGEILRPEAPRAAAEEIPRSARNDEGGVSAPRHPEHSKPGGLRGEVAKRPSIHTSSYECAVRPGVEGSRVFPKGERFRTRPFPRLLAALALAVALVVCGAAAAFAAGGAPGAGTGDAANAPALSEPGPLALAALAAGEPEQSEGGSVVGILLDNTPASATDPDAPDVGDSYLGILLAPGEGELVDVTYMLAEGAEYTRDKVAPGWLAAKPARDPSWPATLPWPDGFKGEPVFGAWCTKDAAGAMTPYDFSQPVLADLVLWASWADGGLAEVTVTLDAGEGGLVPDPADPTSAPARTQQLRLRPGAVYPALPTPERTGWDFAGWFTDQTGGDQVWPVPAGAPPATVPGADCTLWAHWTAKTYWVHYAIDQAAGTYYDQRVPYDQSPSAAFVKWDELAALGYTAPQNKKFLGWHTDPGGDDAKGTFYGEGNPVPDLAQAAPGGSLNVYAVWQGEHADDEFDVRFVYADGATADKVLTDVPAGTLIDPFDDPKRTGYQFAGWWLRANDQPDGAPVRQWKFAEAVHADLVLYAKWDLRLDVTLPVEVGFAVDADSREVTTPEADLYAIKSRTVVPVQVEEVAVISDEDEIEEFFNLREGAAGWKSALQDTALWVWRTGPGGASSWTTDFAEPPDGAGGLSFALPLANAAGERGEYTLVNPDGRPGETVSGWRNAKALAGNDSFRLEKFEYGGTAFDEGWQGGDPSVSLPLKLGMGISGDLEVETALDGPRPLTHLIVTVSAKG